MWQVKKGAFKILPIAGDHFEMYRNMEKGKHYIVHLELTCCRSLYLKKKKRSKIKFYTPDSLSEQLAFCFFGELCRRFPST